MDPLEHFIFSQSSLQDFVDCERKFELRYFQHVAWPGTQTEPAREHERHIQRGERFHRLAQQYLVGLPVEKLNRLAETDEDEHLLGWWRNFLETIPAELVGKRHVEIGLEAPLGSYRLQAKYDLVLIRPESGAIIYDWKTVLRRPSREQLLDRLQTRVYLYLLAKAGGALNSGRAIEPEQIVMNYWFADPSQPLERIEYDTQRYHADEQYLLETVDQIRYARPFTQTRRDKICTYCIYRSLCGRGDDTGPLDGRDELEDAAGYDFDLEQIGEISF